VTDLVANGASGRALEHLDFEISARVARAARVKRLDRAPNDPTFRPLRVFALDQSAGVLEGATATLNVPYERLKPGPAGALIRVIDDGLTGLIGERLPPPLDLDNSLVMIGQGRAPSATDPDFRAQMAYAVCSATYAAFRRALGRAPSWGFDGDGEHTQLVVRSCVADLRNAEYSSSRGEIRLGAFLANDTVTGRNVPRQPVCTALSHDLVVHEMTHALLDGLRARFLVPSNPDVLAFHEAFSDLIAIFQRFSYRDVVRAAIRQTRGDLDHESVLAQIGRQFAETAGFGNALRTAIIDSNRRYDPKADPHALGEVLVAAVFRAYRTVFQRKAARFVRLATNGTGVLPEGEPPELLVDRLTDLASATAEQFLTICVRAIDYCPPVDLTFGEYLRAVITADHDLVPDDPWGYREAWADAFREHGILPQGVRALTQDALRWETPDIPLPDVPELSFGQLEVGDDPAEPAGAGALRDQALALARLVTDPRYRRTFGFARNGDDELGGDQVDVPSIESIRTSRRVGPDGQIVFDLVAEVIQVRRVQAEGTGPRSKPGFDYYGGSTVIIDPRGQVRYLIRKSVFNPSRKEAQRDHVMAHLDSFWSRGSDNHAYASPTPLGRLHAVRDASAVPPREIASVPAAHLTSSDAEKVTRASVGARAYPIGEAGAPRRDGNTPDVRAQNLCSIVDWLAVDTSERYKPANKKRFSALYAADFCYLANVYLPRVWWNGVALSKLAGGATNVQAELGKTAGTQSTNALFDWLVEYGLKFGWQRLTDATGAQQAANSGAVAVIAARRADAKKSGQITVVVPEHDGWAAVMDATGLIPLQSQAGKVNRRYFASRWWTSPKYIDRGFWVHP
jgi:hypothetical protein